jgi:hypothetical protein
LESRIGSILDYHADKRSKRNFAKEGFDDGVRSG